MTGIRRQPPKCGRPKQRTKYGNLLCQKPRAKTPDGSTAPACKQHLSPAELQRLNIV